MSDTNLFHEHLDECQQCRDHPFALCPTGDRRLRAAALGEEDSLVLLDEITSLFPRSPELEAMHKRFLQGLNDKASEEG